MTHFEVVDGKPYHVGRLVRAMRPDLRARMIALGMAPHHELRDTFARSAFRKAWLVDGRPVALGGVTGTLLSGSGFIWLVFAVEALRHPKALLAEARRQLDKLLETRDELTTKIPVADAASVRFAVRLGFRPVPFSNDGGMMEMVLRRAVPTIDPDAPTPFIIYGLPRSRTKWLSVFLNYPGWTCHHDLPATVHSARGVVDLLAAERSGTVETGMEAAWPMLHREFPAARIVVVRRPIEDVRRSLDRHGWAFPPGELEARSARLDEIAALPNAISVTFDDLATEVACRRVFEHCLRQPFDRDWWLSLAAANIQIDMEARAAVIEAKAPEITSFYRQALARSAAVTIQTERFGAFSRDGMALFAEHYDEAGSFDGVPLDLNWKMFEAMDATNGLLVMTARVAGSLVGYILFLISDSLENRTMRVGYQNAFFVLPEFRGHLGRRLHEHALAELRQRGIATAVMRSGVLASGPKQARYFERLGAKSLGTLYLLRLGA